MSRYDDIINLPHYEPKHKRMPIENRAAQFAPFAALTGHGAAINETARHTEKKKELSDEEKHEISKRLAFAIENQSLITITYFLHDQTKEGGSYQEVSGVVKKIDLIERVVFIKDGTNVLLNNVVGVKFE